MRNRWLPCAFPRALAVSGPVALSTASLASAPELYLLKLAPAVFNRQASSPRAVAVRTFGVHRLALAFGLAARHESNGLALHDVGQEG